MLREWRGGCTRAACLAVLTALASTGCMIQMYPGPKLPRDETARITSARASIASIDGLALPMGSTFMVRAGEHAVSATTTDAEGDKVGPILFCFNAKGGGSYQVIFIGIEHRVLSMLDQETGLSVETPPSAAGPACSSPSARPVVSARVSAPPADETARAPDATPTRRSTVAPGPPPDRVAPVIDDEVLQGRRRARARHLSETADVQPKAIRHPGNGFLLDLGAFFGGTDLATATFSDGSTSTLSGGSGVLVSLGLMWTPLWAGDGVGLGFDAFAGVKYDSIGSSLSSLSITRYPLGLGAHALLHLGDCWWFIVRGGIVKEFGVSLSASGQLYGNADLTGSLGGFGEGGIYYLMSRFGGHAAFVLTFRYSASRDSANGASISANSAGPIAAIHFNF